MPIPVPKNIIEEGVEVSIVRESILKKLGSGKKLRIKLGIDPTAPDLHLGHAVVLWKLREFEEMGHQVVLIIGDFTASIGDPSGRSVTRPSLTKKEIRDNLKGYLSQASKIINTRKAEIKYNSKWLSKLRTEEILRLLSHLSVNRVLDRDDFSKRLGSGQSVRMSELIYPVLQAYDSIAVRADIECGGTDQTFNLLMGRELMEKMGLEPQDIITTPLLVGTDGEQKMSKSLKNDIALNDAPNSMFGKIMSLPDSLITSYARLAAHIPKDEIERMEVGIKEGTIHPRDAKLDVAKKIVELYYPEKEAQQAKESFVAVFSQGQAPKDLVELKLGHAEMSLLDLVVAADSSLSRSEARRLIMGGAVEVDGEIVNRSNQIILLKESRVLRIGKKKFIKVHS